MSDEPHSLDDNKPSQAEGDDPDRPDTETVLTEHGRPSQAEGDDPDDTTPVHEVLDED